MQVRVCMSMCECGECTCMVRGEMLAGAGRADGRGDCPRMDGYMAWLAASQIEHSTYAGHPAYSRYDCRQPCFKGVS